jgi:hypothetical protein
VAHIIYRKTVNNKDIEQLQIDLNRLGEWAFENAKEINPTKSKAVSFTTAQVKKPLNYSLRNGVIPDASSCKYLGIILRSDLSWAHQVNYTAKKAWKALNFTMCIPKKGNSTTSSVAYTSLVRTILEYGHVGGGGGVCWDPHREGQINASDRVQKKTAKFAHHRNDSNWETSAQRRKISRICRLFKAYTGERAWKATGDVTNSVLSEQGRS